ncbi:hypothetical protein CR513_57707, partial [Mucuna pruriens]
MPDIALPADFKTPKFEKYKGSSCPRVHLAILMGTTLSWYVNLEKGQVKTWRDLAEAFVRQYRYNEDMAPDRSRLQNLSKKESERFKDYAQQWHELAAQVQLPLTEKEMTTMFIDTLPSPFYDKVVGSVASNFANLVTVGKRIEAGLKRRMIIQARSSTGFIKMSVQERRKGEANAIIMDPSNPYDKGRNPALATAISQPKAAVTSTSGAQDARPAR